MSQCLLCGNGACDQNYKEQVLCQGCENEVQEMRAWLCPRGRPSNLYDPDLVEWPINEADRRYPNASVVATLSRDTSRRFVDSWVVFKRPFPKTTLQANEGIYKGYIASLLVCLYFQSIDDQNFKKTMQKAEDLFCDSKFSENGEKSNTRAVNPFRFEIWDEFFDSNLKNKLLQEVIPDGLISGYDEFKRHSEVFCGLISIRISKAKQNVDSNQKRIAKYLGCICTLNSIKALFGTKFDSCLNKFNELLSDIKGSVLNDSYLHSAPTPTPPAKRQKKGSATASKSVALYNGQNLSRVFDSPDKKVVDPMAPVLGSLSDNDAYDLTPFGLHAFNAAGNDAATAVHYSHATVTRTTIVSNVGDDHIAEFLDQLFQKVFKCGSLCFKDKQFHEHAMAWNIRDKLNTPGPQANLPISPYGQIANDVETGRRLGRDQSFMLVLLKSHNGFCEYVKEQDGGKVDYNRLIERIFDNK